MRRSQQAAEDWRMAQRSEVERFGKRLSLMLSLLKMARKRCSVEDMADSYLPLSTRISGCGVEQTIDLQAPRL